MNDDALEALGDLFPPTTRQPEKRQEGGVLTRAAVEHALAEMWNPPRPYTPPGYTPAGVPFGAVPVAAKPPEWTVEADGYRLVIKDGAIIGLECDGWAA